LDRKESPGHCIKLELTGLEVWFSNININIAFKEELLKRGVFSRILACSKLGWQYASPILTSPKDLEDAKHLRIVYSEMVDETEIDLIKKLIQRLRL
jgi:hypothetical protein